MLFTKNRVRALRILVHDYFPMTSRPNSINAKRKIILIGLGVNVNILSTLAILSQNACRIL